MVQDTEAGTGPAVEALFAEARRRRRRRLTAGLLAVVAVAGAAATGAVMFGGPGPGRPHAGPRGPVSAVTKSSAARVALPPVRVAWVDFAGQLQLNNLATGAQRGGPETDSSLSLPLVTAAGHVYWSNASLRLAPVHSYDIATGRTADVGPGRAVFASADGRRLYLVTSSSTVTERHGNGSGPGLVRHVPAGWHVSTDLAVQAAGPVAGGGILVYSRPEPDYRQSLSTRDGIWFPATGRVRLIATGEDITSAFTPPGAHYSLLTAVNDRSWLRVNGPVLTIINTATRDAVTVRSPLHHGFAASGIPAFSPDGTRVALYARQLALGSGGKSVLAIASTRTGAVRLVRRVAVDTTEDAYWSLWLPGGQRLLTGAEGAGLAVNTRNLTARQFPLFTGPGETGSTGFSAVVVGPAG
jgi:hypothetical protein